MKGDGGGGGGCWNAVQKRPCQCPKPERQQGAHAGQARCEAGDACVCEAIDGKIECVKMGQGLEALREQRECSVPNAAALQPEQLQGGAVGEPSTQRRTCQSTDGVSMQVKAGKQGESRQRQVLQVVVVNAAGKKKDVSRSLEILQGPRANAPLWQKETNNYLQEPRYKMRNAVNSESD